MGNSVCLRVKRGKPGNYSADWLYERKGETELQIPKKMSDRESLEIRQMLNHADYSGAQP
jgi:hypothetical protein